VTDTGADITDVAVTPLSMVRGSGRIVVPSEDRAALPSLVRVSAVPVPVEGSPGPQWVGNMRPDGTFEFRTWPGPHRIRVDIGGSGWTVKAVRQDGKDVAGQVLTFVQGRHVTGLEVELARRQRGS
jgi:hypothetical protein